jgi:uncharacterized YccA/Bax inhibitor family protein
MSALTRGYVWVRIELTRLTDAVRQYWKRILVGAFIGWIVAVVGGAFVLVGLEKEGLLSQSTSDDAGIVIVLYCVGIGALNAYVFRPARERSRAPSSEARRRSGPQ